MALIDFPASPEPGELYIYETDDNRNLVYQYYVPDPLVGGDPYWKVYGDYDFSNGQNKLYVQVPGDVMTGDLYNFDPLNPSSQTALKSFRADIPNSSSEDDGSFDLKRKTQIASMTAVEITHNAIIGGSPIVGNTVSVTKKPQYKGGEPDTYPTYTYQWEYVEWGNGFIASSDTVTKAEVSYAGTGGYSPNIAVTNVTTTGLNTSDTGIGLVVTANTNSKGYVNSVDVTTAGSNYAPGQLYTLNSGNADTNIVIVDTVADGAYPDPNETASWKTYPSATSDELKLLPVADLGIDQSVYQGYYVRCQVTVTRGLSADQTQTSYSENVIGIIA